MIINKSKYVDDKCIYISKEITSIFPQRAHCHMTVNTSIQTGKIGHRNFILHYCLIPGFIQKKPFFTCVLHRNSPDVFWSVLDLSYLKNEVVKIFFFFFPPQNVFILVFENFDYCCLWYFSEVRKSCASATGSQAHACSKPVKKFCDPMVGLSGSWEQAALKPVEELSCFLFIFFKIKKRNSRNKVPNKQVFPEMIWQQLTIALLLWLPPESCDTHRGLSKQKWNWFISVLVQSNVVNKKV